MNKLYMCIECGRRGDGKETRRCPDCSKKMVEVTGRCDSLFVERSLIPGFGMADLRYTIEAIQDMKVAQVELQAYRASEPSEEEIELWNKISDRGLFGRIRTPEITEQEIKDWQHYDELFAKLNIAEAKKRYNVLVLREPEDEPYADICIDSCDCYAAENSNNGEPFEWMKKAYNFDSFWEYWKERNGPNR